MKRVIVALIAATGLGALAGRFVWELAMLRRDWQ
jgi:hypothetical protein